MPQEGFEAGKDGSNEEDYGKSSEDGGSADLQAGSQAADEASEEAPAPGTSRGRRLSPEEAMEPDLSDILQAVLPCRKMTMIWRQRQSA